MDTSQVLEKAKSIIDGHWFQGGLTDGEGNFCLTAAVGIASGIYCVQDDGQVAFEVVKHTSLDAEINYFSAMAALSFFLPEPFDSVPVFNDHSSTTLQDVLAVVDKAIAEVS